MDVKITFNTIAYSLCNVLIHLGHLTSAVQGGYYAIDVPYLAYMDHTQLSVFNAAHISCSINSRQLFLENVIQMVRRDTTVHEK